MHLKIDCLSKANMKNMQPFAIDSIKMVNSTNYYLILNILVKLLSYYILFQSARNVMALKMVTPVLILGIVMKILVFVMICSLVIVVNQDVSYSFVRNKNTFFDIFFFSNWGRRGTSEMLFAELNLVFLSKTIYVQKHRK